MNVIELYSLTQWANREVVENQLLGKYQNILNMLLQNNHQFKTLGEDEKNDLLETLKSIDFTILTKDQVDFLDELQILSDIGFYGVSQIKDVLFLNQVTVGTASQELKKVVKNLGEGINKITAISSGLSGLVRDEIGEYQDEVIIRVGFLGDASISNFKHFKDWGDSWYFIGHGIAMAHGVAPENIKIIGATRGSIILELLTNPEIAKTVGSIILWCQKVVKNHLEIKSMLASMKHRKVKDAVLEEHLTKKTAESETYTEDDIDEIMTILIEEIKLNKKLDGDKIETLKKSAIALFDFNRRGGTVKLIAPTKEKDSDEPDPFLKIREIDTKIRDLIIELNIIKLEISGGNQKRLE